MIISISQDINYTNIEFTITLYKNLFKSEKNKFKSLRHLCKIYGKVLL